MEQLQPESFDLRHALPISFPAPASVRPMEAMARMAVESEAVKTIRNFPKHQMAREMGLRRMVSMVPRSFSPTVRSMAGYMAPVRPA